MNSTIGIYQPFYKPALIPRLDRGFTPLDWLANPAPALRELTLHRHIAVNKLYARHQLTGLLSPKFFSKTRLSSWRVYDWISENPGYDIYLINGMPYIPYANYNLIERSRLLHNPRFEEWVRLVCCEIGLPLPEQLPRQTNANMCACNYWVASSKFWENLLQEVIRPMLELFTVQRQEHDEIRAYHRYSAPTPVHNLTIIYERLLDHYVAHKKVKALYFDWDGQKLLSLDHFTPPIRAYLERMIPIVDRLDRVGWNSDDITWLRAQYAAVNRGDAADETLVNDATDFDLPRFYPRAD